MAGTDGRDDLFSDGPSLGDMFKGLLHVLGDKLVHETTGDGNHGNHRGHCKGEFPLLLEGDDETDNKGRYETGSYWDLLGDTLLDEI